MEQAKSTTKTRKRNPGFFIILGVLVIGGGWFGISKYLHSLSHEETDDAQISGHVSPVIPRVTGYVTEVRVSDNQLVKKGDTILVLDNQEYAVKLEQARAALLLAESNRMGASASTTVSEANVLTSAASVGTIDAQIEAARVTLWRASQDFDRYSNLVKDHSITQQQFEQAQAAKESAEKQLGILEEQKKQAIRQTNAVSRQSEATAVQIKVADASIRQRQAELEAAELNLSYTVVTAAADGQVSKVNVQPGQLVQAGQALFSIVLDNQIWVVANFKETQLEKMTEGQPVDIHADAFPDHSFQASVGSFSPATGATFALLPPDNASGNFVKTVQRVPVRIEFKEPGDSLLKKLRPGMNVTVDVHIN